MKHYSTPELSAKQAAQVDALWDAEYPAKLRGRFRLLLQDASRSRHHLIEDEEGNVMAWAVDFDKQGETRFSIIVDSRHQGKRLGSLLVEMLRDANEACYGWVIDHNNDSKLNGEPYRSPLSFYRKLGLEVLDGERIDNELLQAVKVKLIRKA